MHPAELAARLAEALAVPLIGIGAGSACDAQVLVLYDMLGITPAGGQILQRLSGRPAQHPGGGGGLCAGGQKRRISRPDHCVA